MAVIDELGEDAAPGIVPQARPTVMLAGFRGVLRLGLCEAIERGGMLAAHGEDLPKGDPLAFLSSLVERQRPEAVLVDCQVLPSAVALRRFVLEHPYTSVAVAVPHELPGRDQALLAAGARAVVPLTVEAEELRGLLWFVARGLVGFSGQPIRDPMAGMAMLSEREAEVFQLLLAGDPVAQIADALGLSRATVNSHRHRIYEKLGVHSRRELKMVAQELWSAGAEREPLPMPGARDRVAYKQAPRQPREHDHAVVVDVSQALGRRWHSRSR
jgi:DNA-binding NarL/FixJ family response regulator